MKRDFQTIRTLTEPLSLLYVEDDDAIRDVMTETFSLLFGRVESAINGREGLERFEAYRLEHGSRFDIVVTDIRMPELDGIAMSREILTVHPDQEIVVLSAHNESEKLIELINLGIGHFLLKPVRQEQLFDTLHKAARRICDHKEKIRLSRKIQQLNHELLEKVEELERIANEDPLTRIANRRRFFEKGEQMLQRSRKDDRSLFLFVMDIDAFKSINDGYGHETGDRVIVELVGIVKAQIDDRDCFARLGGDEFAMILCRHSHSEAMHCGETIRAAIDRPRTIGIQTLHFTISMGMTVLQKDDRTLDDALRRADERLYQAKREGRNRIAG
jgi:diguanylate cyclase (GGDEF)-like protein